jgi:hypothetical protein
VCGLRISAMVKAVQVAVTRPNGMPEDGLSPGFRHQNCQVEACASG